MGTCRAGRDPKGSIPAGRTPELLVNQRGSPPNAAYSIRMPMGRKQQSLYNLGAAMAAPKDAYELIDLINRSTTGVVPWRPASIPIHPNLGGWDQTSIPEAMPCPDPP